MKKIAVIIFGEYRTFDIVQKFWHFPPEVDLWISTWNTSEEERISWVSWNDSIQDYEFHLSPVHQGKRVVLMDRQIVSHQNFSELIEKHPNTKIFIRDVSAKPLNRAGGNTPNMVYHWTRTLADMKHTYLDLGYSDLSEVYAGICGLRIDSLFMFNLNKILQDIQDNPNALHTPSGLNYGEFFNDIGFYGSTPIIDKWISTMSTDKIQETHLDLGRHTVEQNIIHFTSGACISLSARFGAIEYFKRLPILLKEANIDITDMTKVVSFCEQNHLHNIIRSFTSRQIGDSKYTLSSSIIDYCESLRQSSKSI